ncbi:MAG TPA: DEAD/DEAH box helicase [Candidatus Sumerlaeota bacterium]|nr:DEAD/DEAH box helicase [Candidatus Sumerlaeota bacterium]
MPPLPAADQSAIEDALASLQGSRRLRNNIALWHRIPAQPATYAPFPDVLDPALADILRAQGIDQLYSHQAEAVARSLAGEHVVIVTPTASGKTLCYNLPVLQRLLRRPEARALYLFPTKALSHDQYGGLYDLTRALQRDIKVFTFDGDTPAAARRSIRSAGQIVVTNPDMLHTGVLPHHTKWIKLFENLETVVIDELHQYRGVFGSHVANVIRRLRRICRFHGSDPRFICCSATVANPLEMAQTLVEAPFRLIDNNGAPRGERVVVFYNPPVVNQELGIRASSVKESRRVTLRFIERGLQTIVFARSRVRVEILTNYLKRAYAKMGGDPGRIRGYRGGYLPNERREIERGIKNGEILCVVSTNALELGIDIGSLQAAVLCGYPGTIASAWQQGGRAGRKQQTAVMVVVGSSSPMDQYLMAHPEYFLGASPEHGILNPDNIMILSSHLKCAVNEAPLRTDEPFGPAHPAALLDYLEEQRIVRKSGDRYHWSSDSYPAEGVSLRTATPQNFIVHNKSDGNRVLAEVDYDSAQELIHPQAIYMHQGQTFYVDELDWDRRKAFVRLVKADYYTDAVSKSDLFVLHVDESEAWEEKSENPPANQRTENPSDPSDRTDRTDLVSISSPFSPVLSRNFGEVRVDITVPKFKKVKFETQESIGMGDIDLPQYELHTQAAWWTFRPESQAWLEARSLDLSSALKAIAWVVGNVAALHIMSDRRDMPALAMVRSTFDGLPALYVYDRFPGGIGLARRAYGLDRQIFRAALEVIEACRCDHGCPACVGPPLEMGDRARAAARVLLRAMAGGLSLGCKQNGRRHI